MLKVRVASKVPVEGRIVCGVCESREPDLGSLPAAWRQAARRAAKKGSWSGRAGQAVTFAVPGGAVVSLHGLGKAAALDGASLGRWLGEVTAAAPKDGYGRLTVVPPTHPLVAGRAGALQLLRILALADYSFRRSASRARSLELETLSVVPPTAELGTYRRARPIAEAIAGGVALARDLANAPPNEATPEWMAEQARALARSRDLRVRVLGPRQMAARKMGGLLAVGGGSAHPPRLVRLEWGSGKKTVAIVGKGVTFDTGGISIKPSAAMDEMKFDKSGACTALGVAEAASALDLPFRFRVYLPLAENMPGGSAYRPGDIVRCANGKTVEILNTDAEGRMILADALAWAAEEKPDVLLDYATLTGACVVALGYHGAGLFSPDDNLAGELLRAGELSGERLWRLPLWPEFTRDIRGRQADLLNSGSRWGGANTAAAFLAEFTGGARRWAHLDIAGTAWIGAGQNGAFGATGFGVALTLAWLLERAGRLG